ncbi:MAG: Xaa-Pro peptidase family protein [Armatimonadetes bacterium]|nr:Xaa-Pro peptidase family protein [Armatimonadota bacterium]MDW8153174.1 Xaa-Pro peptidase family protein [Armatimonadota bacterium]
MSTQPPPREERDWRIRRIRAAMAEAGLEGLLLWGPAWRRENVRYLTGARIRGGFSAVYLPAVGEPAAFVSREEDRSAVEQAGWVQDVRPLGFPECAELVSRIREGGSPDRVGVALWELVPEALGRALRREFPRTRWVPATDLLDRLRMTKSPWEVEQVRRAARVCEVGWEAFLHALRPGVAEYEVVAEVEGTLKRLGAEDNFLLIASGRDEVRGMTPPGRRRIERGDLVRTELTPQVNGYWAQICRTAVVGAPTKPQIRSLELFREAMEAGLAACRPGVTAHEVAKAQNDVFRKYGYGEYCTSRYTRVRGHGHGLHLDEWPTLLEGVEIPLEENTVLIVHPNTYTPLAGYFVLGDPVVVTREGCKRLVRTEPILFAV